MGEYAEMAMAEMLSIDEYMLNNPEADDDPYWNPFSGRWSGFKSRPKTCKRCGATQLRWGVNPDTEGWELREADWSLHRCKFSFKSKIGQVNS